MSEVMIMFGALIRQKRKEAQLTQKQLGLLCGYEAKSAENVVQNWEYDKQPVPLEKLRALAKALNIPIDSLIP